MKKLESLSLKEFLKDHAEELCLELPESFPKCELILSAPVGIIRSQKTPRFRLKGGTSNLAVAGGDVIEELVKAYPREIEGLLHRLKRRGVAVVIICRPHGKHVQAFSEILESQNLAFVETRLSFNDFVQIFTEKIKDLQSRTLTLHGVLLDILGVGVLIKGPSGIGKSEVALELIMRGARLVSDDAIDVVKRDETSVYGMSPPITRYHMEIRGLGIINIRELFGVSAVRPRKKIELVIEFVRWEEYTNEDPIAAREMTTEIMGVKLPHVVVPVGPGRSLATLVEIAARNYLLKRAGIYSGEDFEKRLEEKTKELHIRRKDQ